MVVGGVIAAMHTTVALADPPPRACVVLEDFSASQPGQFPAQWEIRPASAKWIYTVVLDVGVRFLRATAKKTGIAAGKRVKWQLREHPVLCWKWRPRVFPLNSDESGDRKDSVLAVYVGFEHKWGTLKYHWSERLPVGKEMDKPPFGRTKTHVVASGIPKLQAPFSEVCVDVDADYRRRFGEKDSDAADGIGVMSDADDTDSYAEGDYADFRICTR
jgi:hypothetical protein